MNAADGEFVTVMKKGKPTGDLPYHSKPTGDLPYRGKPTGDLPYHSKPTGGLNEWIVFDKTHGLTYKCTLNKTQANR